MGYQAFWSNKVFESLGLCSNSNRTAEQCTEAPKMTANIRSLQTDAHGRTSTRSTAQDEPWLIKFRGGCLDNPSLHMSGEHSLGNRQKLQSWPHVPRESLIEPRELEQRVSHIACIYKGLSCRSLTGRASLISFFYILLSPQLDLQLD